MIPELSIIKLCLSTAEREEVASILSSTDFPKELQGVYRTLLSIEGDATVGDLANLFFSTRPRDPEFYQGIFEQLDRSDSSPDTTFKLVLAMQQSKLLRELSMDAYDVSEGRSDISKVLSKLEALNGNDLLYSDSDNTLDGLEFVSDDLNVLVSDAITKPGLCWRLGTLNRMLGSLRRGDFGFLFARPETGKTTFLASEVTHMAAQTNSSILWFNNEEQGQKVMLRAYQAALGIDRITLLRDLDGNKQKFHELTRGNIRLYDNGVIHKRTVETMCKRFKPSLIIFDQIDKLQGFDDDREDLRLGGIYQWARELAKTYAPVIGVCQANGTGENQKWLTMSHVANSATAKQAEADFILGIGKINEPGYDQLRYLHLSKNKLTGDTDTDSNLRHGRQEVLINAEIARYVDI